ncbi:hypothetical protein L1987_78015 [Smallanthus sonchifolius]|uniref:Uncharacterized protein n=1 Tax=Smallanthus sonchifolius TaxID=185202 RepID=A0ACB8ZB75_9ASTR|nr:hypothetical protein L1987_78015 [Smallanthus sonchifolius]
MLVGCKRCLTVRLRLIDETVCRFINYKYASIVRNQDEGRNWGCELVSEPKAQSGNDYSKSEIEEYPIDIIMWMITTNRHNDVAIPN